MSRFLFVLLRLGLIGALIAPPANAVQPSLRWSTPVHSAAVSSQALSHRPLSIEDPAQRLYRTLWPKKWSRLAWLSGTLPALSLVYPEEIASLLSIAGENHHNIWASLAFVSWGVSFGLYGCGLVALRAAHAALDGIRRSLRILSVFFTGVGIAAAISLLKQPESPLYQPLCILTNLGTAAFIAFWSFALEKEINSAPSRSETSRWRNMPGRGLALVFLVALSPLLLVLALLVSVESPGSPIFAQERRPPTGGPILTLYKFRTFDEPGQKPTRLRRWIGLSRLDELPNLWNLVRGDLDWFGPRPIMLAEYETIRSQPTAQQERIRGGLFSKTNLVKMLYLEVLGENIALEEMRRRSTVDNTRDSIAYRAAILGWAAGAFGVLLTATLFPDPEKRWLRALAHCLDPMLFPASKWDLQTIFMPVLTHRWNGVST